MDNIHRLLLALAFSTPLVTGAAHANSLLDSVKSTAEQYGKSAGSSSSLPSMSSLTNLLNGGDKALSAGTMNNATGILQYCVQNNVLSSDGTTAIKDQLMSKLGISGTETAKSTDYEEGLGGLLKTSEGKSVNLNDLGTGQITEKIKTKACDLVLKQGKSFLLK
ncbi:DUF2501 domain-containing protein [Yersinia similis]|uniref:Putative glycoprotein/receptor n=1 Tax=Yersinia similis TaxID=367190 RepID=A0A0T9RHR4_9GAMM|nr:DUF2501 domain-containing protein [Yersinia similis]CNC47787.1 putative glycoprotein/receptor precursor [Yersinia similis]CNE27028.1 putative glycoprotein/receptor precursor [Yersinia similis]CNG43812.1 putative glycoprotein/receptor precursor [Yersinia similis]CNI61760.1 putative glycoprotein/receptor precursor [Yersinia similis]